LNCSHQTGVTKAENVSTDLHINLVGTESARDIESSEKLRTFPKEQIIDRRQPVTNLCTSPTRLQLCHNTSKRERSMSVI